MRLLDLVREGVAERVNRGQPPTSLLVLTNAGQDPLDDAVVAQVLTGLVERENIAVARTDEISTELEARPSLRRSVPAVLGLGPVESLIDEAVRSRSTCDLDMAAEVARVFVATAPYMRALDVLERHSFSVLTGPPEMGKTAIARMIGLAQLTAGWQVHECAHPDDVFRAYEREREQVFIADDAFGSTEYSPDSAERWARELDRILARMDERHWLLWTSRPAPLRAGLRRVHRERGLERFPQPGDVLVDASYLATWEKALILFRHAKAAHLAEPVVGFVKTEGVRVVGHPYFTPERIRRFVADTLPNVDVARRSDADALVDAALREPTRAMTASLRALGAEHRDLLVAMLDAHGASINQRELAAAVRRHHDGGLSRPPAELFDRLADHFLKVSDVAVRWVHPSWRDLVIDDLASDPDRRRRFVSRCGLDGLALAISTQGGRRGARVFPLLLQDADWDVAADRVWQLVPNLDHPELARLLRVLGSATAWARDAKSKRESENLALAALDLTAQRFEGETFPLEVLDAWVETAGTLEYAPPVPRLARTWADLLPAVPIAAGSPRELERVDDWLRLAQLLERYDPEQLAEFGFPDRYSETIDAMLSAAREVRADPQHADLEPLLARALERLRQLIPEPRSWDAETVLVELRARHVETEPEFSQVTAPLLDPDLSVARILSDLG